MAVPSILPESSVRIFKFYDQGTIHEAVLAYGKIMRLAGIFSPAHTQDAFDFARKLCPNYFTLITPGHTLYRVWVDLRCPDDFSLGLSLPIYPQDGATADLETTPADCA